uniref:DYW domain-containing protein n=1 Tax=Kalanchoe fedtschenkoi TaxID=63787 RepID=A0A7N0UEQ5_KALFE
MECRLRNPPQPLTDASATKPTWDASPGSASTLQTLIRLVLQPWPFQSNYGLIFQLLTGRNLLKLGQQLHAHLTVRGLTPGRFLGAKIVAFYASCGCLDASATMFERVGVASGLVYNAMIRAYAKSGACGKALGLYVKMRALCLGADHFTLPFVLKSCADLRWRLMGRSVHGQSLRTGLAEDMYVGASLIGMYVKCGRNRDGQKVFDEIPVRDVASWNSLITGYMNDGEVRKGMDLFQRMPLRNVVSWTAVISGFSLNGLDDRALGLFREICEDGSVVKPHWVTIVSVLSSCAHLAALESGRWVHKYADSVGLGSQLPVQRALVAMYARCGSLSEARSCFDSIQQRNRAVWNSLITAYASHGRGMDCARTFEEMIKTGIQPDHVTFVGLLSGCSHSGLTEVGLRYFDTMKSVFFVEPGREHYSCVVSLLARAGWLAEALDLINGMPMEPGPDIWSALLSASRSQRNLEIAESAATKLSVTDPECTGSYALISNILSESGMWEKGSNLKSFLRSRGLKRSPGCSWIEVNRKSSVFFSGDASHPLKNEIRSLLEELVEKIKGAGYEPDTGFVPFEISKEEKLHNVMTHSEKLAIAFGFLSSPHGVTLRVTKNLRICGDCHTFVKFVSSVSGREIIVRDVNRFHQFKNGTCSCGEVW